METISCNVVKDLLPLYIDEILSVDSHVLVEAHLTTCLECKEYCGNLKGASVPMMAKSNVDGKEAIRKIRKRINKKKFSAVCLTAILIMAIALGLYYCIFVKQSYLPYEKAGLYIEDGVLRTSEPYYCYYASDSPEEDTIFVYLTTTVYESHGSQHKNVTVDEMFREYIYTGDENGENEVVNRTEIKKVYYIPQEYAKLIREGHWISGGTEQEHQTENRERLEELKKVSVLIGEEE